MAELAANGAQSTLATPPSGTTGTSLVIQTADTGKFPATGDFACLLQDSLTAPTQFEIIEVTGVSGATFTVTRASESYAGGTTAQTWAAGAYITLVATAGTVGKVATGIISPGDLTVGNASGQPARLPIGLGGQVLKVLTASNAVLFANNDSGSTIWVQAPYVQPALASLSFMVWLYIPSTGPGGNNPEVFGTSSFYSVATGCGLGYDLGANGNVPSGVAFALNAGTSVTVVDPTVPSQGAWYCYVATYDGTTAILYRNGTSVASAAASGSCVASTEDVTLANAPDSGGGRGWGGMLAHVAFFPGTALTATDASDLYSNASTLAEAAYESYVEGLSPLLYYPLQETGGATATNRGTGGSTDNGTYSATGITYAEPGPVTSGASTIGWVG